MKENLDDIKCSKLPNYLYERFKIENFTLGALDSREFQNS